MDCGTWWDQTIIWKGKAKGHLTLYVFIHVESYGGFHISAETLNNKNIMHPEAANAFVAICHRYIKYQEKLY